jgi:HK97 family phage portal protein
VITRVRGGGEIELRAFALTDMLKFGYGGLRNASPSATEKDTKGIPAINRAARIRSEALASLRLRMWRGDGPDRTRNDTTWQARLFRDAPNEYCSRFEFWETVGESLAYRNNAYVWKAVDPITLRVIELYALHPDQVRCEGADDYKVDVRKGYVDPVGKGPATYVVDSATVLHIRGHGNGGTREAPTTIQQFREALGGPIARQRYESRMWQKGSPLKIAVKFPVGVSKEQGDVWKSAWRSEYEGSEGESTAFLGGGADVVPIGMTMVDAQYVEMARLTVHDASRIMGVPANLLGAQTEKPVPNLEQDLAMWLRFGLGPELERIESALLADDELFGPKSSVYPAFDTEGFVRGDVAVEDTIAHNRVQDGRLLVDEWRHSQGLPPLPNGAGQVPQIVPVGGGPNPASKAPVPSSNGASADD